MAHYYVIELREEASGRTASRAVGQWVISCMPPVSWEDGEIRIEGPCASAGGYRIHAHGAFGALEPARWAVHELAREAGVKAGAVGASPEAPLPNLPEGAESDPWSGVIEVYRFPERVTSDSSGPG